MSRRLSLVIVSALALAAQTRAGSVDNRNNNSAEYIRSLSRNAATEGADASIYNPAGTTRFADGLYLSLSNQTIAKFNEHKLAKPSVAYESDIVSPIYPTAFAVYKRGNWSAFSAFSFPGGGGELDYKEGSVTVFPLSTNLSSFHPPRNADVYLRSVYYGFTAGGAYRLNDMISLSLAARTLYARTDVNVNADTTLPPRNTSDLIDHMEEARGTTGILGVDVFPMKGLILGLRVEGPTSLEWEVQKSDMNLESVIKDAGFRAQYEAAVRQVLRAPGSKFQRDLPANIGLGAGYDLGSGMRADASFNYYLNTLADWGGKEDEHDDGWEASLSFQYLWPFRLLTSAGAQYTVSGANSASYSIENPALNSYSIAAGGRYGITDRLGVNAGFTGNFAIEDNAPVPPPINTTAELHKHVLVYALGLEYRFF